MQQEVKNEKPDEYPAMDSDNTYWNEGSETFTRKEVYYLLATQRAMISNDLKRYCGDFLTPDMYEVLEEPRIPKY